MEQSDALSAFQSLGNATRLAVFRLLVQAGRDGAFPTDIAAGLGLPASTLSSHLASLTTARLIRATRQGRAIRYTADMDSLRGLLSWLVQDCCGGHPETCAPLLAQIPCHC